MTTKKPRSPSHERLKKAQLALYLDPAQADALKVLSLKTRVPQQVYLREGLDLVLRKHGIFPVKLQRTR